MDALVLENQQIPENIRETRIHPQKFALWIGIACMIMMFAGLTSAYIVRKAAGNWVEFVLPINFYISMGIITISSFTMHRAKVAFRNDNLGMYRLSLGVTFLLGCTFLANQILAFYRLNEIGIYLSGNPSGSFVIVIGLLHFVHVFFGLLFLLISFAKSFIVFSNPANFLIYRTDSNKKIGIELLATYWYFVDILWLYLLIFFIVV